MFVVYRLSNVHRCLESMLLCSSILHDTNFHFLKCTVSISSYYKCPIFKYIRKTSMITLLPLKCWLDISICQTVIFCSLFVETNCKCYRRLCRLHHICTCKHSPWQHYKQNILWYFSIIKTYSLITCHFVYVVPNFA